MTYTADIIKASIEAEEERLFASWRVGRPDGWTPDPRTKAVVCLGYWMREELQRLGFDDHDRKTQEWAFNRRVRSDHEPYALAAELMNDALAGRIDRNRRPHRRWG